MAVTLVDGLRALINPREWLHCGGEPLPRLLDALQALGSTDQRVSIAEAAKRFADRVTSEAARDNLREAVGSLLIELNRLIGQSTEQDPRVLRTADFNLVTKSVPAPSAGGVGTAVYLGLLDDGIPADHPARHLGVPPVTLPDGRQAIALQTDQPVLRTTPLRPWVWSADARTATSWYANVLRAEENERRLEQQRDQLAKQQREREKKARDLLAGRVL